MTQLVTFCSNLDTLKTLQNHPLDHLILEDPKLSLRSYDTTIQPGFDHLIPLAEAARKAFPGIALSFNLDILVHHRHFPLISQLLKTLEKAQVSTIRLQDPGLATWLKTQNPNLTLHLATETGNQNLESLQFYANFFARQVLSNEMPVAQIRHLQTKFSTEFEIQVLGPILIQYSARRYMAFAENTDEILIKTAYDLEYPGRKYPFYDNPHGHLMYLYFDRSLLAVAAELKDLNLTAWLIDGRGESPEYLQNGLNLFADVRSGTPLNPDTLRALTQAARRPLKPGFFKANLTDQDRDQAWDAHPETPVAILVDFEKKKDMLLEVKQPLQVGQTYTIVTPKHQHLPFTPTTLTTLDGTPITTAKPGQWVKTPWQKGVIAQSRVYLS